MDETTVKGYLKARSDLDLLFELNCRYQNPSREQQHADHSNLTVDSKASERWRALQVPLGYGKPPWDSNWQPPLEGIPSEIAAEFHVIVCRVIFRIPFFDFVKYALGYNTTGYHLGSLLHAVCDVRDGLRTAFQGRPGIKDIYVEVEKALRQQYHPLAHWIVASKNRSSPPYPPGRNDSNGIAEGFE